MNSNDQKAALAAERQRKMYGVDDIKTWMDLTLAHYPNGAGMLLASMMSDAQEEIAKNRGDSARCTLNRAKRLLSEIMERGLPLARKADRPDRENRDGATPGASSVMADELDDQDPDAVEAFERSGPRRMP